MNAKENQFSLTRGASINRRRRNFLSVISISGRHIVSLALLCVACAALADGRIIVWGDTSSGKTNVPSTAAHTVALAGGDDHYLALQADGTVVAWGKNDVGQTNVPMNLTNTVGIAAGSTHSLALRTDGTVALWGRFMDTTINTVPRQATNGLALALGPGAQHAVALRGDDTLVDWGSSSRYDALLTNPPPSATNLVSVAAGSYYALGLRANGTMVAWGYSQGSEARIPVAATNVVAIAAGWYHSMALRADGTMVVWGGMGNPPASLHATNIVDIAAGGNHVLALRRDRTVLAWGSDDYGQCRVPASATNISFIAGGSRGSLALQGSGPPVLQTPLIGRTVMGGSPAFFHVRAAGAFPLRYQWRFNGTNLVGETNLVLALNNVQPTQAGPYSVEVINDAGRVTSPDIPLTVLPIQILVQPVDVVAYSGGSAVFNVTAEGTGLKYQWQFNGTNIVEATNRSLTLSAVRFPEAGSYSVVVTTDFGGTTSSAAQLVVVPIRINRQPTPQVVFRGATASLSVDAEAERPLSYQWQFDGSSIDGAAGSSLTLTNVEYSDSGLYVAHLSTDLHSTNSTPARLAVVPVAAWVAQGEVPPDLTNVLSVSAGWSHSLAVKSDSTVAAWGSNDFHQIEIPVGLTNVVSVAAGGRHSVALEAGGRVSVWGDNSLGQLNVPTAATNVVAVAAGWHHSLALKADGTVVAWGATNFGVASVPAGLTTAVAIAARDWNNLVLTSDGSVVGWGYLTNAVPFLTNAVAIAAAGYHGLALRPDGIVVAWGMDFMGQLNIPAELTNVVSIASTTYAGLALTTEGVVVGWGNDPITMPVGLQNVTAISAGWSQILAIVGDGPPVTQGVLAPSKSDAEGFQVSFESHCGQVYRLEYAESIPASSWAALPLVAGNGRTLTLSDPSPTTLQRFYRVRRW